MRIIKKNIFTTFSLLSLTFFANGCVLRNADDTYHSTYSYHPYNRNRVLREPIYNNNRLADSIEKVAKSLLGTDYKYGANGPYQYDCSGFTKYVFSRHGINIPRVSKDQARVGKYVSANELQKGDLIFFDSKRSAEVSHVGIYLSGGYFIHASSSKDQVTISNLNSNYYSRHFKWGRRVINMRYVRR